MKQNSSKGEAIERLRQLDEQLRVIESGARDVEGGLRESSKVGGRTEGEQQGSGLVVRAGGDGREKVGWEKVEGTCNGSSFAEIISVHCQNSFISCCSY